MSSKFLVPLHLSVINTTPSVNPEPGFVKVYVKSNYLKYLNSVGVETDVVLARPLDGFVLPGAASAVLTTDTVLSAIAKLQKSLSSLTLTGDVTGSASYVGGVLTIQTTVLVSGITPTDIANWNTAYGWGNHATAGYQLLSQKGAANGYASLDSAGKVPVSQLPSSIMEYKGVWNASTNSPNLTNGTGDPGDVYRVTVAGTVNLGSGPISFEVGDYVIYNGTIWEKSDTTDAVASVNGFTGNVVLTTNDIAENTNLYFTNTRARAAISLTTIGSSGAATYNNLTGVINIPVYDTTADNGLTKTGVNTQLGGTLLAETLINNGVFSLTLTGTKASTVSGVLDVKNTSVSGNTIALFVENVSNNGNATAFRVNSPNGAAGIVSISTSAVAVSGTATTANGGRFQSTSAVGVEGISTSSRAGAFNILPASSTGILPVISLTRFATVSPTAGIGGSIEFNLSNTSTSSLAGSLAFVSTDANFATRTSQFEVRTVDNGGTNTRRFYVTGPGYLGIDTIPLNDDALTQILVRDNSTGLVKYRNVSTIISPETDPVFTASAAFGITSTNISNWNTAYGWGNHALAGYVTTAGARLAISLTTTGTSGVATYDNTTGVLNIPNYATTALTVGTSPILSGTVGRLLFEGTGNVLQESANLFWDQTNSRLAIGGITPTARIHVSDTVNDNYLLSLDRGSDRAFSFRLGGSGTTDRFIIHNPSGLSNGSNEVGVLTTSGFNGRSTFTIRGFEPSGNPSAAQAAIRFEAAGTPDAMQSAFLFVGLSNRIYDSFASQPSFIRLTGTVAASSGTGNFAWLRIAPTINQTGGSGENVGIIYEPTLTSITGTHYGLVIRPTNTLNGIGHEASLPTATWHVKGSSNTTGSVFRAENLSNTSSLILDNNGILTLNATGGGSNYDAFNITTGGVGAYQFRVISGYRVLNFNIPVGSLSINGIASTTSANIGLYSEAIFLGKSSTNIASQLTLGYDIGGIDNTYTKNNNVATNLFSIRGIYNISSGTGAMVYFNLTPDINQTGSASGRVVGIDYNPTLTSILGAHYGLLVRPSTLNGFGLGATLPTSTIHVKSNSDNTGSVLKLESLSNNILEAFNTRDILIGGGSVSADTQVTINPYRAPGTTNYVLQVNAGANNFMHFINSPGSTVGGLRISRDVIALGRRALLIGSGTTDAFWITSNGSIAINPNNAAGINTNEISNQGIINSNDVGSNGLYFVTAGTQRGFIFQHLGTGSTNTTQSVFQIRKTFTDAGGTSYTERLLNFNGTYDLTNATKNLIGIDYDMTITALSGAHYGLLIRPTGTLNGIGHTTNLPTATWHVKGSSDTTGSVLRAENLSNTSSFVVDNNGVSSFTFPTNGKVLINGAVGAGDTLLEIRRTTSSSGGFIFRSDNGANQALNTTNGAFNIGTVDNSNITLNPGTGAVILNTGLNSYNSVNSAGAQFRIGVGGGVNARWINYGYHDFGNQHIIQGVKNGTTPEADRISLNPYGGGVNIYAETADTNIIIAGGTGLRIWRSSNANGVLITQTTGGAGSFNITHADTTNAQGNANILITQGDNAIFAAGKQSAASNTKNHFYGTGYGTITDYALFAGHSYGGLGAERGITFSNTNNTANPAIIQGVHSGVGRTLSLQYYGSNVGIGAIQPTAKLHVKGESDTVGNAFVTENLSNTANLTLANTGVFSHSFTNTDYSGVNTGFAAELKRTTNTGLRFGTNAVFNPGNFNGSTNVSIIQSQHSNAVSVLKINPYGGAIHIGSLNNDVIIGNVTQNTESTGTVIIGSGALYANTTSVPNLIVSPRGITAGLRFWGYGNDINSVIMGENNNITFVRQIIQIGYNNPYAFETTFSTAARLEINVAHRTMVDSSAGNQGNSYYQRISWMKSGAAADQWSYMMIGSHATSSMGFQMKVSPDAVTFTNGNIALNPFGGNIAINLSTAPTARLHIAAGTATAGTAPIKLNTGTPLTTPEDGALEYHSSHLYFTIGSTRYQLDQQSGGPGGPGTVTDVSVVSANGFAGTVATSTSTPAITISTTVTGLLKGNGTAISAAVAGTDYVVPSALSNYLPLSGGTLTGALTTGGDFIVTAPGAGSIEFYPAGGSTATYSVLKARLGSGLAPTLAFYGDNAGSYRGYGIYGADSTYDGLLFYRETGSVADVMFAGANQISLPYTQKIAWASNVNSVGTLDIGIARNAAGVLEVNTGTVGIFANLKFLGATVTGLAGTGTRMVVADSTGVLSTQAIPSGSSAYTVTTQTSAYTVTATSGTIIVLGDTTGGTFSVNLPTAVGNTATIIIKKSAGTAALVIDSNGSETVDGSATASLIKVNESLTLISDNTNWQII